MFSTAYTIILNASSLLLLFFLANDDKVTETYRFLLYSLTAPLGSSCQEPGDSEYDPPDNTSDGEEIKEHKKQSAAFALRAEHHCVHTWRMDRFGTGCIVSQQETDEVYERDKAVADSVEDYGALRVAETFDVNEESEEGKESGPQTDDGAHADETLGEFNVVGFEVHVGARRSTVLGTQEGRSITWLGLQLQGAPEAQIPLSWWRHHRGSCRKNWTIRGATRVQSGG